MNDTDPNPLGQLDVRVTKLEELFMHLQRTVEQLDEVALGLHRRLDGLDARLTRLNQQIGQLMEDRDEG